MLKENPTLHELQSYVKTVLRERGFEDETITEKCLLLGEEVGELFKAVRKRTGVKHDPHSSSGGMEDELADVLIYVLDIANKGDIDLEKAFRSKEERNARRVWK